MGEMMETDYDQERKRRWGAYLNIICVFVQIFRKNTII